MTTAINPIAAFDVLLGTATALTDPTPGLDLNDGYRWLHLDLTDETQKPWTAQHLPNVADRAMWQTTTRPRCERHEDGLILNLRGVNLNPSATPEDMVSLRLWVQRHSIVSARLRKVWAIDDINAQAANGTAPATVGRFLSDVTYGLTTRIEAVSIDLEEQTDALEDASENGRSVDHAQIAALRQTTIKLRRFVHPQRDAIASLAAMEDWIFNPEELALLRETSNRTRRVVEELDATRDRLSAIQDHLDAKRAHDLSRNSYILSIIAAIFLPLGFLTGLFGVNVAGMPGTDTASAFWMLTGASILSGLVLFLIFKFSKWL